jgi:hypothetical protein
MGSPEKRSFQQWHHQGERWKHLCLMAIHSDTHPIGQSQGPLESHGKGHKMFLYSGCKGQNSIFIWFNLLVVPSVTTLLSHLIPSLCPHSLCEDRETDILKRMERELCSYTLWILCAQWMRAQFLAPTTGIYNICNSSSRNLTPSSGLYRHWYCCIHINPPRHTHSHN